MTYCENFYPVMHVEENGYKTVWNSSYLEVGTECFRYPGLFKDEKTILVYSVLLSIRDNPRYNALKIEPSDRPSNICFCRINRIARLLNTTTDRVERSIEKLVELKLISVVAHAPKSIGIEINKDLRYDREGKKKIIRIYDRIFAYPTITYPMIILYSYYLKLSKTLTFQSYKTACSNYGKITMTLGYLKNEIISILDDLASLGLVTIVKRHNSEGVFLEVDFSQKQPEELIVEDFLYKETLKLKQKQEIEDYLLHEQNTLEEQLELMING